MCSIACFVRSEKAASAVVLLSPRHARHARKTYKLVPLASCRLALQAPRSCLLEGPPRTCFSPCGLPLERPSPPPPLGSAVDEEAILSASCAASGLLPGCPEGCPGLPACCPPPGGLPSELLLTASRLARCAPSDRRCPFVVTTAGPKQDRTPRVTTLRSRSCRTGRWRGAGGSK